MDVLHQNSQPGIKLLSRVYRPPAPTAFQWRLQEQTGLTSIIDELTSWPWPPGRGRHNHGSVISFNCWEGRQTAPLAIVSTWPTQSWNMMLGNKYLESQFVSFFLIPVNMTMVRTCRTRRRGYISVCSHEPFSCSAVVLRCVMHLGLPGPLILLSILVSHLLLVPRIIEPLIQPATSSPHATALHFH